MAAETCSGGGRAGFVIVSGPVTRTSISDSSSMRPPSIITAPSSWTSSTQSSSPSAATRAQPRSGWRVWAWRPTPRTGSCCTTSWSGPAWTTSMPSATCWSPRAVSTCAPRYGRTTENSCYWLLNFPYVGVHPAVAQLLRPGGGGGHRADRQGECGGVSPEHLSKISK